MSISCLLKSIISVKYFESDFLEKRHHWKGDAMGLCAMGNHDQTFCPKLLSTKQTFDLYFLVSVT